MKSLSKLALHLLTVIGVTTTLLSPASAQLDSRTQELLDGYDSMTRDMVLFTQLAERQNQLRYPCSQGDQRACEEIRQIDRQIEQLMNRLN